MSKDQPTHTPKDSHYANLRRAHRDQKRSNDPAAPEPLRLYGIHTVSAALMNPDRVLHRLLVTRNALARLDVKEADIHCPVEIVDPKAIDKLLDGDAVHQGVLLETEALAPLRLDALGDASLILVLDQVTDPHNVGAILRSATAFAADGMITTSRHSPQEGGVLAKAASGALEHVKQIEVRNLAETLEKLSKLGFRTIGLDSDGETSFEDALDADKVAIVLGAEGKGLRQKTRETCDALARLEMPGAIRSLNVSNAAAIALYATRRRLKP
ncbi:23S rRNA (guanosine(2251)-2'-O)-methyltransferase RlmB [Fulvimarina sp. 2208YS6-2-32]|uniref:23S rRNA (Guanosine(2251)-2'-O)-methyltransferase RlmB n=1 Tax=Fulvimarina uroteuthidis TaxID=3098149 RepID=A0ABU5I707_9HYPH|nr:23S rRNA (guanosine(2251)-2'-O)-methyltransferase RlmB [Fulvimarina sp. 2208YS6-2-32]MDY8111178.1 23S rRNA (guanosine(2251)-2'-O)-methyltransferase RlmB [Fulvimarina sp. 2208YS6-2-32]